MSPVEFLEQTIGIRNRSRCVHSDKPGLGNIVTEAVSLKRDLLNPTAGVLCSEMNSARKANEIKGFGMAVLMPNLTRITF